MANRTPFDDRGNPDIRLDDISPMLVLDYLKRVDSKLVNDFHKTPIEDILDKMDLFTGPTERRMLKNVAAMMFCEEPAKFFPYTQVEIVLFPNGLEQYPSNMIEIPKISGPVPYMIKATLDYLRTNLIKERIVKPKDSAESDKFFNYPYQAFEEAVVNALYHRDYQEREPVEIRIEPQGVAILSYAGPDRSISMEAIQKAKLLKARRYRNRRLGDFLKELDLSEGRATGIPTIQDELRKNGSQPARIETDDERSYFLIEIPCREGFQIAIDPIVQESELKSKLKSKLKDELKGELKTLRIILDLIAEDPGATIATLVTKSGKSRSTVLKSIKVLKDEYCIDRVGGKKYGRWVVLM